MLSPGRYKVARISGLLPPWGVTKKLWETTGCTYLFGLPIGRFRIKGDRFVYLRWPIVDRLEPEEDEPGRGRKGVGLIAGFIPFCRFQLVPLDAPVVM